ncbi:MAG: hypothetical protein C0490_11260 [Marivirga sp.]|nr:hypothetical protein [Marivirga sp.]
MNESLSESLSGEKKNISQGRNLRELTNVDLQMKKLSLTLHEWDITRKTVMAVRKEPQKCYNPSCKKMSIRSHVMQKAGPLREIAVEGKIVQLEISQKAMKTSGGNAIYSFKEMGIDAGDVVKFFGFCNDCDQNIFREVENNPNYSNYQVQLLLAYRALCNELYKNEYHLKAHNKILTSKERLPTAVKQWALQWKPVALSKIEYITVVKKKIENELCTKPWVRRIKETFGLNRFAFLHLTLPKKEICCSAAFSFPNRSGGAMHTNFIQLMPRGSDLHVVLGSFYEDEAPSRMDWHKMKAFSEAEQLKFLSDILIRNVETWVISKKLHQLWLTNGKLKEILYHKHHHLDVEMKDQPVNYCMF